MQIFEIKLTNRQVREYNYFLGNRYGKNKKLTNKLKIAIMEMVAIQARDEVTKTEVIAEANEHLEKYWE